MRCISLWEPWATLVVIGEKKIETRHWATAYRGPLLIHAAKRWTWFEQASLVREEPFLGILRKAWNSATHIWMSKPPTLGKILGCVHLGGCYEIGQAENSMPILHAGSGNSLAVPFDELPFGNYAEGRFAWSLPNALRFETPIPYKGHQSFFDVPDELVAEQIAQAQAKARTA